MIILKILLWILLAILGIIIVVCVIPADVDFSYIDGKMKYKVKIWFFDLMDSSKEGFLDKRKRKKAEKSQKKKEPADEQELPEEDLDVYDDIGDEAESPEETASAEETADVISEENAANAPAADEKPSKKEKKKKHKHKDNTAEDSDDWDNDADDEPKKPLGEKLEKLGNIWLAAKNPANMIFKGFKFRNFYIDFIIANEDAYKCAVNYGRYTTLIYNGLAQLSRLFTIRFKTVDIQPGFGLDKGRWDTSFSVSFRLGTAVIAGIWFLITYLFRVLIPKKLKNHKMKKAAAVQK
jgi:hypothetical protein